MIRARLEFKLADCWIGAFWKRDQSTLHIWICVVPCFPLHVEMMRA
jgi:hypothetical protein